MTDRLYNGGSLYLTLSGLTEYSAQKIWLDEGENASRPTGTFQLWRFRKGQSYTTASQVRDPETGELVTFGVRTSETEYEINDDDASILGNLPKYDNEGYEYIYVLRENLDSTGENNASADSYEQVFGRVGEDGNVTDDVVKGDSDGKRDSGDTYLYNRGILTNRITGTVRAEAAKVWEAAAFQAQLSDVDVEFTLQYRVKGSKEEWKDYKNAEGNSVTWTNPKNFVAENMDTMQASALVDKYDAQGKELEYRWVETGVYQGEGGTNLLKEDDTFTLEQGDRKVEYTASVSEVQVASGSYVNKVVNKVKNELSYKITKKWQDKDGNPSEPREKSITLYLYQIQSGSSLTPGMRPLVEIKLGTDITDEKPVSVKDTEITYQRNEWYVDIQHLPEFDGQGREYEYLLLEEGGIPTYNITRDENNNYIVEVINGPGPGNRIMVRKQWLDDNDAQHRLPVQVEVYDKETNTKVAGPVTVGDDGTWQRLIGIEDASPSNVYVKEVSIGKAQDGQNGEYKVVKADPGTFPGVKRKNAIFVRRRITFMK